LGDAAWANRARGELGLVAFLQGDVGGAVVGLGQAIKVAQSNGDISSLVRWLTLFGHGYVQLGRAEEALAFYDRALAAASAVPEIQFPVMTHVGRSSALIRLGRLDEADAVLAQAGDVALRAKALGYQAQLLSQRGMIANQRGQPGEAVARFDEALALARAAGANRLIAEIALESARVQRQQKDIAGAERVLQEGIGVARGIEERFLLPRLLAATAELEASRRRFTAAAGLLDEASDILQGLFTSTSSPWVQSRLVSGMDEVFLARIRLEGARGQGASAMYSAIEDARGRSLIELLANRPLSSQSRPADMREGERRISELQRRLFQTTNTATRRRLLDQIFAAEEQLAPVSTAFFQGARRSTTRVLPSLGRLRRALQPDEIFVEFALANPQSYAVVVTRDSARVQPLQSADAIRDAVDAFLKPLRAGDASVEEGRVLARAVLSAMPELRSRSRLLVSPDGALHHVPFDLLDMNGRRLLDSHIVSYVPSGEVLVTLRSRASSRASRPALALSASFGGQAMPAAKGVTRDAFDLDPSKLRPLPSADDEARSVGTTLGAEASAVLIDTAATEDALKRQPLADYRVLHLAAHGLPSTRFPARAALLLRSGGSDDGVLQAREILLLRLDATLVTLSACDTGSGSIHGQDGPASLVRPFLASGARAVVANLWAADDTFSLALMRAFYRQLATGADIGTALRDAKRDMITTFGPQAVPRLWSGVVAYGDVRGTVVAPARGATTGAVK
ncbi:MAG: CHAT domain-containing protein, partial [Vicinamibacterales bacterium]